MAEHDKLERPSNNVANPRVASEGCSVLLDINDGDKLTFARLNSSATLKIGNMKCSLVPLIGSPFGAMFEVERGTEGPYLLRVSASAKDEDDTDFEKVDDRDNRALVDNNMAQKLSAEDISLMRREGVSGDRIVEALIANSSTFQNKTTFSQEKYKRKKQKKYAPRVLLRRPFARSVCEAYFRKCPAKIGYLRMDTLSLLLSMANVNAYSDVLVLDMLGGLVTGAVAERLGGKGIVCNTYQNLRPPPMDIVGIFNFDELTSSRTFSSETNTATTIFFSLIIRAPLCELLSARNKQVKQLTLKTESNPRSTDTSKVIATSFLNNEISSNGSKSISREVRDQEGISLIENAEENYTLSEKNLYQCTTTEGVQIEKQYCDIELSGTSEMKLEPNIAAKLDGKDDVGCTLPPKVHKTVKAGRQATLEEMLLWAEHGFTSMIVSAPALDTSTIVGQLLPLLSFSAPFAIYHQYLQPLAECMHKLQTEHKAVALQISEPWLREYQVLPSRTHPHMQMSSHGGYILSGIRICGSEFQQGEKS